MATRPIADAASVVDRLVGEMADRYLEAFMLGRDSAYSDSCAEEREEEAAIAVFGDGYARWQTPLRSSSLISSIYQRRMTSRKARVDRPALVLAAEVATKGRAR